MFSNNNLDLQLILIITAISICMCAWKKFPSPCELNAAVSHPMQTL